MPRSRGRILLPFCLVSACTPMDFVWDTKPSDELDAYLASFAAAAGTSIDAARPAPAMLDTIANSRLVWLGDHHRSTHLHRLQLDLLGGLCAQGTRLAFVLEAIGTQDEGEVARWLAGRESLEVLRTTLRTRWPGSWLDADDDLDAPFYRDLVAFAREHRIPIAALEATPRAPIRQRDERMAERVRAAARAWPDRVVVVVVGQAHLLGAGDLVRRTGLGGLTIGGVPPARLAAAAVPRSPGFLRSNGGLWWFADLFADARG
ncbi:MAG: ChaN family lipoprotein [Planctomycetes bacterium]|nr:ChaN family lipoprotein [Planctomycetota bacterium]